MQKFWVIWRDGGGCPTFRHVNFHAVKVEAERLARQFPGSIFHILERVDSCKVADVVWASGKDSDIPF